MTCETETTALAAKIHAECEFCFDRNDIHRALELFGQMVEYAATTAEKIEAFLRLRASDTRPTSPATDAASGEGDPRDRTGE